jgi:hypothetical protein
MVNANLSCHNEAECPHPIRPSNTILGDEQEGGAESGGDTRATEGSGPVHPLVA